MHRIEKLNKVNKGNFAATLIRFNQNLNYEKIYVFQHKSRTILFSTQEIAMFFFYWNGFLNVINTKR
jgi:hypothetical protein